MYIHKDCVHYINIDENRIKLCYVVHTLFDSSKIIYLFKIEGRLGGYNFKMKNTISVLKKCIAKKDIHSKKLVIFFFVLNTVLCVWD